MSYYYNPYCSNQVWYDFERVDAGVFPEVSEAIKANNADRKNRNVFKKVFQFFYPHHLLSQDERIANNLLQLMNVDYDDQDAIPEEIDNVSEHTCSDATPTPSLVVRGSNPITTATYHPNSTRQTMQMLAEYHVQNAGTFEDTERNMQRADAWISSKLTMLMNKAGGGLRARQALEIKLLFLKLVRQKSDYQIATERLEATFAFTENAAVRDYTHKKIPWLGIFSPWRRRPKPRRE